METQNMIGNSRAKLGKKHLDMVAANNLKVAGAGFQGDTNVLTLITQDEDVSLQLMSKEDAANVILDKILSVHEGKGSSNPFTRRRVNKNHMPAVPHRIVSP